MFDSFRQSLNDLMDRATPPEERRIGLARMKETLVHARLGLEDLRAGVTKTQQRLALEEREVQTMKRRREAATAINSSGLVPIPSAKRVQKEYCVAERTPLSVEIVPAPSRRLPSQTTEASRRRISAAAISRERVVGIPLHTS